MNKRIIAVVVVLVLLIGGAGIALAASRMATSPAGSAEPPTQTQTPDEPAPSESGESSSGGSDGATAGAYVDYDGDAIAAAEGRVLLFFHAPWCTQCRSVESDIVAEGVPDGVTIIKVDYDSHQDLRQEYGVTLQTTFVEVTGSGKKLQSHIAYDDPHLDAVIAAML